MSSQANITETRPSTTAQLGTAHRAYHLIKARPPILEDTAAHWLLSPPLSVILRIPPLRWFLWERVLAKVRNIRTFVIVRSRYAEDCLALSIAEGFRQYVILGAGLDSWALRNDRPEVQVFELDLPATQQYKAARIQVQLGKQPPQLTLIPIDFERQSVGEVLDKPPYDSKSPAFVTWLGTIYYLSRGAIEATLNSLATVCAPGSRLVFDYFRPKSTMSPEDRRLFEEVDEGGTKRGEPLQTLMNPGEVADMLHTAGFRVIEDLPAPKIRECYLSGRSDGLDIPDFGRLCYAERVAEG